MVLRLRSDPEWLRQDLEFRRAIALHIWQKQGRFVSMDEIHHTDDLNNGRYIYQLLDDHEGVYIVEFSPLTMQVGIQRWILSSSVKLSTSVLQGPEADRRPGYGKELEHAN